MPEIFSLKRWSMSKYVKSCQSMPTWENMILLYHRILLINTILHSKDTFSSCCKRICILESPFSSDQNKVKYEKYHCTALSISSFLITNPSWKQKREKAKQMYHVVCHYIKRLFQKISEQRHLLWHSFSLLSQNIHYGLDPQWLSWKV